MNNIAPAADEGANSATHLSSPQLQQWPISRLVPYARNPRRNDHAVQQMVQAIETYGFKVPIVAHSVTGEVVDGHLRLKAAIEMGLTSVPVIPADDLSPSQIKAFRLLANRSASWAEWDNQLLALEIADLVDLGYDLDLTGFDADELANLLAESESPQSGETADDVVPEKSAHPVSKPGDLWLLGPHRLLCGDATIAADVSRLLGDEKPLLMVSDPPYGVSYDPSWRNEAGVSSTTRLGMVKNDDRADWREAWALFPGNVAYVWHGGLHADAVKASLEACGFAIRSQIIWRKPRLVLSRGHYHWRHEPCWYAVREACNGNWQGARDQTTVWDIDLQNGEEDSATIHGTQKPVECMLRPMLNNSAPGDFTYEPFCGSGTSLIAAQKSNRRSLAMEIDVAYVDLSIKRWQNYTGQKATRQSDGVTFDTLVSETEGFERGEPAAAVAAKD